MNRGRVIGIALIFAGALAPVTARAQGGTELADLKKALAANQRALEQYSWSQTTAVLVKGEEKSDKVEQVRYGAGGVLEKTQISTSPQPDFPGGFRGRIEKRKAEEIKKYVGEMVQTAQSYAKPAPGAIETAYQAGQVRFGPTGQPGMVAVTISSFVKPNDSMTITFNRPRLAIQNVSANTYLDGPSDTMTMALTFATLPDGTNYMSHGQLNGGEKDVEVTIDNANFLRLANAPAAATAAAAAPGGFQPAAAPVAAAAVSQQPATPAPAASSAVPPSPDPWPKTAQSGGATYTMYQPQLDDWDQYNLSAHAAVSVLAAGAKDPVFGVIEITAKTHVSRATRTVAFSDIRVTEVKFPTVPDAQYQYQQEIQKILTSGPATMPLDRLESNLAILEAQKKSHMVPVQNNPPVFIFTQTPAILVTIDGQPVWTAVPGTQLTRVLNSRALILKDSGGKLYVHVLNGFLTATGLSGPWTVAAQAPPGASQAAAELAKKNVVDLMEGTPDPKTKAKPTLASGAPQIVVATTPTELIVTNGAPEWAPIQGTQLLYVSNTTGNIFQDMSNQQTYVLVTGRWFSGPGLTGPWQNVNPKNLPGDFQMIPDDSPKENVKASIPGTAQAQEAVISDQIAETADIDREKVKFQPQISGEVDLKPIPSTSLTYVANSATPIIQVSPTAWYACNTGVWFTAGSVVGPWTVATSVPAVIYSIPPSSPVYYVTYVKVYAVTPSTVVVGYTPGYMGTVVSSDGLVVYGTGYVYPAYITTTVWVPPPVTYGYAAAVTYTPWTGWAMGFGFGFAMGAMASSWYHYPYWGCAPYWGAMPYAYHGAAYGPYGGAAAWGPGGWAATSGNVYHQYGATSAVTRSSAGYNAWTGNAWAGKVGASYNSVTGRASVGQEGAVSNAYTGNYAAGQRGASYNPNTGVTTRAGSATAGNAYSGQSDSAKWAHATGPGGQTYGVANVNGNYYGSHDGNVYKGDGNGNYQQYNNGSWNNMLKSSGSTQSLQSQESARNAGEQRSSSAASSGAWGGGFGDSGKGWGGSGGGWGGSSGWNHSGSGDGGGFDRSSGSGGFDRGGGGGWGGGGGGRSFGGGSFGGFRGGGRR